MFCVCTSQIPAVSAMSVLKEQQLLAPRPSLGGLQLLKRGMGKGQGCFGEMDYLKEEQTRQQTDQVLISHE